MSLETRITAALTSVAAEVNNAKSARGDLASLTTTNKSSLVAAANELKASIDAITAAEIDDGSTSGTTTWSSTKIASELQAAIDALIAGAPGALDTLNELAAALQDNPDIITDILAAQAKRVRVDAAQSFSAGEQLQARQNIDAASATDVGDTDRDFAADFTGALT